MEPYLWLLNRFTLAIAINLYFVDGGLPTTDKIRNIWWGAWHL